MSDEQKSIVRASKHSTSVSRKPTKRCESLSCDDYEYDYKPCRPKCCDDEKEKCNDSKIVGRGLRALQLAIAVGNAQATAQSIVAIGRIYGGISGVLDPLEVILAVNAIFDVTRRARLSRNKELVPFVQLFAVAGITLLAYIKAILGWSTLEFRRALRLVKAALLFILQLLYGIFPVRKCPTTTRELKHVLDAGVVLLILSNLLFSIIALFPLPPPNPFVPGPAVVVASKSVPRIDATPAVDTGVVVVAQMRVGAPPVFKTAEDVANWIRDLSKHAVFAELSGADNLKSSSSSSKKKTVA